MNNKYIFFILFSFFLVNTASAELEIGVNGSVGVDLIPDTSSVTINWTNINSSAWSRVGSNVFLTYSGDKVGIGTETPGVNADLEIHDSGETVFDSALAWFSTGTEPYPSGLAVGFFNALFGVEEQSAIWDFGNKNISVLIGQQEITKFSNQSVILNGSVGIGTYNPTHELTVEGNSNITGYLYLHDYLYTDFLSALSNLDILTAGSLIPKYDYYSLGNSTNMWNSSWFSENVTAQYYLGDGSYLTGIEGGIWTNDSNTATFDGNASIQNLTMDSEIRHHNSDIYVKVNSSTYSIWI